MSYAGKPREYMVALLSNYFEPVLLARGFLDDRQYSVLCAEIGWYRLHLEFLNGGVKNDHVLAAYNSESNIRKEGIHLDEEFPYSLIVVDRHGNCDYDEEDEPLRAKHLRLLKSQTPNPAATRAFFTTKCDAPFQPKFWNERTTGPDPLVAIYGEKPAAALGLSVKPREQFKLRSIGTEITPMLEAML